MNDFWNSLHPAWQACLEEAWLAYCEGSLPIGAIVVDEQGVILGRGRNRWHESSTECNQVSGSHLAHAELNALLQLPQDRSDYRSWSLYTTLEPCPLCIGACYMFGLRNLHFAARDPWAGSTNILGTTPYMSLKNVQVYPPQNSDLENILIGIGSVAILQDRITKRQEVLESTRVHFPAGVQFGEALFAAGTLSQLKGDLTKAPEAFDHLLGLWRQHERRYSLQ